MLGDGNINKKKTSFSPPNRIDLLPKSIQDLSLNSIGQQMSGQNKKPASRGRSRERSESITSWKSWAPSSKRAGYSTGINRPLKKYFWKFLKYQRLKR